MSKKKSVVNWTTRHVDTSKLKRDALPWLKINIIDVGTKKNTMKTKHTPQIWHSNLDRVFSWITIPDGTRNPPVVARDLSEEDCTSIVHSHNQHAALVAALAGIVANYNGQLDCLSPVICGEDFIESASALLAAEGVAK